MTWLLRSTRGGLTSCCVRSLRLDSPILGAELCAVGAEGVVCVVMCCICHVCHVRGVCVLCVCALRGVLRLNLFAQ